MRQELTPTQQEAAEKDQLRQRLADLRNLQYQTDAEINLLLEDFAMGITNHSITLEEFETTATEITDLAVKNKMKILRNDITQMVGQNIDRIDSARVIKKATSYVENGLMTWEDLGTTSEEIHAWMSEKFPSGFNARPKGHIHTAIFGEKESLLNKGTIIPFTRVRPSNGKNSNRPHS